MRMALARMFHEFTLGRRLWWPGWCSSAHAGDWARFGADRPLTPIRETGL